ncbi:hypothetical protein [Streptomyces sp. NPDC057854]|uniref:hypothetical protein n=1 Tax=unclassified Streptomyces TaxID=2593676 RepID=UPI00367EAA7D
MSLAAAARAAGVPDSTLGLWRAEDAPFRTALDGVRALAEASGEAPRSRLSAPAVTRLLLQALREGRPVTAAAAHAGVSPSTVYARRRRDPSFAAWMDAARAEGTRARARTRSARRGTLHRWEGRYRLISRDAADD